MIGPALAGTGPGTVSGKIFAGSYGGRGVNNSRQSSNFVPSASPFVGFR